MVESVHRWCCSRTVESPPAAVATDPVVQRCPVPVVRCWPVARLVTECVAAVS